MEPIIQLIFTVFLLVAPLTLGFLIGSWRERSHIRSLDAREQAVGDVVVTNLKTIAQPSTIQGAAMVMGEAVIATDYFKTFVSGLKSIIGGELKAYNKLMSRARREATLRMIEEARRHGAAEVWNVRYETSNVMSASTQRGKKVKATCVEVLAFGTAVVRS